MYGYMHNVDFMHFSCVFSRVVAEIAQRWTGAAGFQTLANCYERFVLVCCVVQPVYTYSHASAAWFSLFPQAWNTIFDCL